MAHGDFYFAINATFYYIADRWGEEGLRAYWQSLGRDFLAPLAAGFVSAGAAGAEAAGAEAAGAEAAGSGAAIARYWADYFAAEPGGEVVVTQPDAESVVLDVRDCPAIAWLTRSPEAAVHPPPHPLYCQHCLHINRALAANAGYGFVLEGGGGRCRQTFALGTQPD